MSERYFAVAVNGPSIYNGRHILDTDVTTVYNGYLAMIEATTGDMKISTGSPYGMFYDFMQMPNTEFPTTDNLATWMSGLDINVVTGVFEAFVGKDLFSAGVLPAIGAKLYDNGAGLLATAGTAVIGGVEGTAVVQNKAGVQTVARCKFDFSAIV